MIRPAIPADGLIGETALREAATTELHQVIELIRGAVRKVAAVREGEWVNIVAVYPDRAVVQREGRLYAYPWTLDATNAITLGAAIEVVLDHTPVAMREGRPSAGAREAGAAGASIFVEALAADASAPPRYLVRVIRAGTSLNGVDYPRAVLREAVSLFDGVRVFVKSDVEHTQGKADAKDFRRLVGKLSDARFVEANGGEVQAVLDVLETSSVAQTLRECVARGMTDLFGLSIDAEGTAKQKGTFREATKLIKVSSVDLIIEPGAGGQVIRFVESKAQKEPDMLRTQMISQIAVANAALAASLASADDSAVLTAYREAVAAPSNHPPASVAPVRPANGLAGEQVDSIEARFRLIEARADARAAVNAAALPQATKDRLIQRFAEATVIADGAVASAIKDEREYLLRVTEGARITGLGEPRVEAGQDRSDKVTAMLDAFFDPTQPARSFREAYIDITGDREVSGLLEQCDTQRLREAVGETRFREAVSASTFSNVLGNSITRAMIRDYGALEAYTDWRWLADVVPVRDFRTQERTRMGGYGNLPAVAENAAYAALTSPTDEKATYAATKRGGVETVSLEAVTNDDVGLLRRIPMALATSAGRTLYEFIYDFIATNAVIYDTVALFHASHANLGTAALSDASFAAARLAINKQTEKDSLKRLGLTLRHIAVPSELEETAFNMFVRNTNNDETFVQSRKPTVHVVDYWTDVNNWFAMANNNQVPLIEIGFYGGEEPSLFVQDAPTQGSLFSNDQIKYKIRHVYGGAVRDFRGFYGAIVA